jgi:hypothetical protein
VSRSISAIVVTIDVEEDSSTDNISEWVRASELLLKIKKRIENKSLIDIVTTDINLTN